jgi:hypothetical protein
MLEKCDSNINSRVALVDNIEVSAKNFNRDIHKNPKCSKGHELVHVNSEERVKYFRHKNSADCHSSGTGEWHSEWQSHFLNTEISFPKINDNQISDRRADVVVNDIVLELQHSNITQTEVNNRNADYGLNNKKIIWLLDGNDNCYKNNNKERINVCNLPDGRCFLEFKKWLCFFSSYKDCDIVFVDINTKIYKVPIKNVKAFMIDVEAPIDKETFIEYIKSNSDYLWSYNEQLYQSTLYLYQLGAGNGKTYSLINNIFTDEKLAHYKYFIITTKMHSARTVIYNEFKSQYNEYIAVKEQPTLRDPEKKYLECELLETLDTIETKHKTETKDGGNLKKYIIPFINKSGNHVKIIIATVDALVYSLGNRDILDIDKFKGITKSIIDKYLDDNKIHDMKLGSEDNIKLNKQMCLCIDETQDLDKIYGEAIIEIMQSKYIDGYIIGDKLQSISVADNAFNYLYNYDFSYINKIVTAPNNICRRFNSCELANFVNSVVQFEKNNLPQIKPYEAINERDNIKIFSKTSSRKSNSDDEYTQYKTDAMHSDLLQIMTYYDSEVKNGRSPKDFLIITPFTSKNTLVEMLTLSINKYWIDMIETSQEYEQYAIFHKSEEGKCIDLTESDEKTRIVSIHSSKGDGRPVVFVLGLNEDALLKFSNGEHNLIYESLIHVALTRQKEKLYFLLDHNGDDLCTRIEKYCGKNNVIINSSIEFNKTQIKTGLSKKNIFYEQFDFIYDNIISNAKANRKWEDTETQIVDMSHHNIRYATMNIFFDIECLKAQRFLNREQVVKQIYPKYADIYRIAPTNITIEDNLKVYINKLSGNLNKESSKLRSTPNSYNSKCVSVLNISKNKKYNEYSRIIYNYINDIKDRKLNKFNSLVENFTLCPLEVMILYYMRETVQHGLAASISINDLYIILDIYEKTFTSRMPGHEDCICKKTFCNNPSNLNDNIDSLQKYLFKFYETTQNLEGKLKSFFKNYNKVNWLNGHCLTSNNDIIKFTSKFDKIGYTNDYVYFIELKPQINAINYNQILLDNILKVFYVINWTKNCEDTSDANYQKFARKKFKSFIFTLDEKDTDPFILEWYTNDGINLVEQHYEHLLEIYKNNIRNEFNTHIKNIHDYALRLKRFEFCNQTYINVLDHVAKQFKSDDKTNNLNQYVHDKLTKFSGVIEEKYKKLDNNLKRGKITKENYNEKILKINKSVENIEKFTERFDVNSIIENIK